LGRLLAIFKQWKSKGWGREEENLRFEEDEQVFIRVSTMIGSQQRDFNTLLENGVMGLVEE
jgi:hypothetical protein